MTLQVCPPELLETKDKIETKEAQPYWKPSSLKDGESEEFRLLGCYETGHAIMGWQYASEILKTRSLVIFDLMVMWLLGLILVVLADIARETDWSKADRPKIDGTYVKPRRFLAWVATSATRGRLEVLFIEQKSIREQLTEILQEVEDYTWTEEGLANFSIKISKKGAGLDTRYTIMPKVRAVPDKIKKQWKTESESIWLPNYFEGKDPFDGKQVDEKGLPAGGTDKRGAHVSPAKEKVKVVDDNAEF